MVSYRTRQKRAVGCGAAECKQLGKVSTGVDWQNSMRGVHENPQLASSSVVRRRGWPSDSTCTWRSDGWDTERHVSPAFTAAETGKPPECRSVGDGATQPGPPTWGDVTQPQKGETLMPAAAWGTRGRHAQ